MEGEGGAKKVFEALRGADEPDVLAVRSGGLAALDLLIDSLDALGR